MELTPADRRLLDGGGGGGAQLAMQLIVRVAEAIRAPRLIDISWAHVGSAYYNGQANIDFAEKLIRLGTRVAIPTTLTTCSLNLQRLDDSDPDDRNTSLHLIDLYESMGCRPTMTCAPYHVRAEPELGEHVAWTESSAVVYANSILGARTNAYVEFLDMCAAITGRAPDAGLHRTENRRASVVVELHDLPSRWLDDDRFFHVLGFLIGRTVGDDIPAIVGLPDTARTEQLRAIGSAGAASGALKLFHAVGITPEGATLEEASQGAPPSRRIRVGPADLRAAAEQLGAAGGDDVVGAVCLGTPHFSLAEFEQLVPLIRGVRVHKGVRFYVSTSEHVLSEVEEHGWLATLHAAGVTPVTGRCTYYAPLVAGCDGRVVTNSAKWAYYAAGSLGSRPTFASLEDCVRAAASGRVRSDAEFWSDGS